MGALTTALFVFYMLVAPLTGWLGDRFPRKPLIIAGAVLWSLARWERPGFTTTGPLYPPCAGGGGRSHIRHLCAGRAGRFLSRAGPQPHSVDFLSGDSRGRGTWAIWRAGNWARCGAGGRLFSLRDSWAGDCRALRMDGPRAGARRQRPRQATADRATVLGLFSNPAFLDGNLRPGHADLCHGRHFGLGADVSAPLGAALGGQRRAWRWAPSRWWTGLPERWWAAGWRSAGCAPITARSICSHSGA